MANSETLIAAEAGVAELSAEGTPAADTRGRWGWALYEGARDPNVVFQIYVISPFFATVMIRDPIQGQGLWGEITTYSGFITMALCPFFGAIADRGGPRKPWLAFFSVLMVLAFAGTWFGTANASSAVVWIVCAAVIVNNVAFELSNAFHGAMLSSIAPASRIGSLSGLSFALGSGSGALLMLLFLVAFLTPHPLLSLPEHVPERLSGPVTAAWMLIFALPLFLYTPDRARSGLPLWQVVRDGILAVVATIRSLKHYRNVAHYIVARTLFNDGLTGVLTFGGIYAAGVFQLDTLPMVVFGIVQVFFGMLGGFLGGWLDDRLGSKRALLIAIGGTSFCFGTALTMGPDRIFWFIPAHGTLPLAIYTVLSCANAVFVVAGYANNRTMLARIAPIEKMTEFFGLMSFSGTAATFLAPLGVKLLTDTTHSQRGGMLAVLVLLLAGWAWMWLVKEERAAAAG